MGSIPIGSVSLDGPLSLGYRKRKPRAGANPAPSGRHFPLALLSVFDFFDGSQDWVIALTDVVLLVRVQPSAPDAGVAEWYST